MSVARPCAAKNRIRKPENQVQSSSGVPCRYELIWSWNVPWSTVLILTAMPVFAVNESAAACIAFFGAASHYVERSVTAPVRLAPGPTEDGGVDAAGGCDATAAVLLLGAVDAPGP